MVQSIRQANKTGTLNRYLLGAFLRDSTTRS
jgi:hypothetical protein